MQFTLKYLMLAVLCISCFLGGLMFERQISRHNDGSINEFNFLGNILKEDPNRLSAHLVVIYKYDEKHEYYPSEMSGVGGPGIKYEIIEREFGDGL